MDQQHTKGSSDNPSFSPVSQPPRQPMAGVLGNFATTVAKWSGGALIVGLALAGGNALLPERFSPAHWIANTTGVMVSDETKAHTAATAELARQNAIAQALPPVKMQALSESMQTQGTIANLADAACAISNFFGPGRDAQYADMRDGLRSACGTGAAIRQNRGYQTICSKSYAKRPRVGT
jgi:hypothetical protein